MKTKIGISAGIIGAAAYFLGLVGGWIPIVLIAGYVLIAEQNQWLRMAVVKAVIICVFFAIIRTFIDFIPNIMSLIDNIAGLFRANISTGDVYRVVSFFNTAVTIIEKIVMLMLGFASFRMGTVNIGFVDRLIAQHTLSDSE